MLENIFQLKDDLRVGFNLLDSTFGIFNKPLEKFLDHRNI